MTPLHRELLGLRERISRVPEPDADTLLVWEDALDRLRRRLPGVPALDQLSLQRAAAVLEKSLHAIHRTSRFGAELIAPLSLAALARPSDLLAQVHIHPTLPQGIYARSQPYRGRIEISPPSERFHDPRYHLGALLEGRLPLEIRALQHELVHLHQVDARRELMLLVVMCLIPLFWPVLVYLYLARIHKRTAASYLAAQEIQAHLSELELDADPEGAAARTIVALSQYPFARYLRPGELEQMTALIQALRTMSIEPAGLVQMFQAMPPLGGTRLLAREVQRGCRQRGWDSNMLRRAVRRRELLLLVDQLLVKAIARSQAWSP